MHQFPQACLLINLFEQGKLTESNLKELGKVVAKFHRQALTNNYITQFGDIEVIKKALDENYQQSEKYINIIQTQNNLARQKNLLITFFESCRIF